MGARITLHLHTFLLKEINRGMDTVTRMIKVVIKDLEREKNLQLIIQSINSNYF